MANSETNELVNASAMRKQRRDDLRKIYTKHIEMHTMHLNRHRRDIATAQADWDNIQRRYLQEGTAIDPSVARELARCIKFDMDQAERAEEIIQHATRQIDMGTQGLCAGCKGLIDLEILEKHPLTIHCSSCIYFHQLEKELERIKSLKVDDEPVAQGGFGDGDAMKERDERLRPELIGNRPGERRRIA